MILEDFDFNLLNESSFKEDSVREEIIVPILRELGYSASGENQIIRSKNLTHPFFYIGSIKRSISIIPDYILQVNNKNVLVLDAKSPNENILSGSNVEQTFSYAIHPEVRVAYYGLCNGRELSLFHISEMKPVLYLKLDNINSKWKEIYNKLSPLALTKPYLLDYKPDFGIFLTKAGCKPNMEVILLDMWVNSIYKQEDDLYSIFSNLVIDQENTYAASFDFTKDKYKQFLNSIPTDKKVLVESSLRSMPYYLLITEETRFQVAVHAKLSNKVIKTINDTFIPFEVDKFEPSY